jgi:tetratricopeptide (TPR) repeat protein
MAQPFSRFYQKALAASQAGNWLKAVHFLKHLQEQDHSFLPAYYELVQIYLQQGHVMLAKETIGRALSIAPQDTNSLLILADIQLSLEEADQALAVYLELEKRSDPPAPDLLLHIALAYSMKREWDTALSYLEMAIDQEPEFLEAFELEGKIRLERGEFEEAAAALMDVLDLEPEHQTANHLLGVIYSKQGRWRAAIRQWESTLSISPNADETLREMGGAWIKLGQEERAVSTFKRALEINPKNLQARIDLGIILMKRKQVDEAIAQWELARRSDPNNPIVKKFLTDARHLLRQSS